MLFRSSDNYHCKRQLSSGNNPLRIPPSHLPRTCAALCTVGEEAGLVGRAETDVVEDEDGVGGQRPVAVAMLPGDVGQQFQSPVEPEDVQLAVLPLRQAHQQAQPQPQQTPSLPPAPLGDRHSQEALQEMTLDEEGEGKGELCEL